MLAAINQHPKSPLIGIQYSTPKHNCAVGPRPEEYSTHFLRRTKASIVYKKTGSLRAIQILLGHSKI